MSEPKSMTGERLAAWQSVATYDGDIAELTTEVVRLRKALLKYGGHQRGFAGHECVTWRPCSDARLVLCDCGWYETVTAIKTSAT